jgi:predicted Zn-dependent peptidase
MTPLPPPTGSRRVIEKPAQQAQVLIGYVGPRIADPDYAAVKVLSAVVGGGMSGRLFFELRDKRGLAYSIGVTNPSRSGPAPLFAHMGTGPGTVDAAEQGLLRELERIRVEPPSETELARAKGYILGNLALDRRTVARRAWYLAFFEGAGVAWDFPDRYARDVAAVTVADVQRAAERYFRSPTVVVLQPARR